MGSRMWSVVCLLLLLLTGLPPTSLQEPGLQQTSAEQTSVAWTPTWTDVDQHHGDQRSTPVPGLDNSSPLTTSRTAETYSDATQTMATLPPEVSCSSGQEGATQEHLPPPPSSPSSLRISPLSSSSPSLSSLSSSSSSSSSPSSSSSSSIADQTTTRAPGVVESDSITDDSLHAGQSSTTWHQADQSTECLLEHYFISLNDTIEWTDNVRVGRHCRLSWKIRLPPQYGIVLQFHYIDVQSGGDLLIFNSQNVLEKHFSPENGPTPYIVTNYTSMGPFLYHGSAVDIQLAPAFGLSHADPASFSISYTAHPLEYMPAPVAASGGVGLRDSYVQYHCAGLASLPRVILCDGIPHCVDGEDEADCAYRKAGCGSWFPYGDHCLKAFFADHSAADDRKGAGFWLTAPTEAEVQCQRDHGATLAIFPDRASLAIAKNLVIASGFLNAVVGIQKVKPASDRLKHLYRYLWQWGDRGSPVDFQNPQLQRYGMDVSCAMLKAAGHTFQALQCVQPRGPPNGFLCMRANPSRATSPPQSGPPRQQQGLAVALPRPSAAVDAFPTEECSDGSLVHNFHHCVWQTGPAGSPSGSKGSWSPGSLPLFECYHGQGVHYSLICDGKRDCTDGSDEMDCHMPKYPPLLTSSFVCRNLQTVNTEHRCDGKADCFDDSDEEYCVTCKPGFILCPNFGCLPRRYAQQNPSCPFQDTVLPEQERKLPPGNVQLDGYGMSGLDFTLGECSEGFYRCRSGVCIPTFLVNNGEKDCWDGDDEGIAGSDLTCPGYYRCHGVGTCVHRDYLCDGVYHCPYKDDERFCNLTCPRGCVCEGWAFTCSSMIDPLQHLHVRYLDVSHARNVSLEDLHAMEYLAFLNLSYCFMDHVIITDMQQLRILDLRYNSLTGLNSLNVSSLPRLTYLDLSNNPFLQTVDTAFYSWLRGGEFRSLHTLIMANVTLKTMEEKALSTLHRLQRLDIRHNDVQRLSKDSLEGLVSLEVLLTDQPKLCCSYFHPSSLLGRCSAPRDELSTCDDLLGEDFFRIFLWVVSLPAVAGNAGVLIYRFLADRHSVTAHSVLVKNLCVSDLLMGVYLVVIGVADVRFRGNYLATEEEWTSSLACHMAGVLSFVSSEVSSFVICFITLERILVVVFPFKTHLHVHFRAAVFICGMIWALAVILAVVPLALGLEFYGESGICIPLPITRTQFSGQGYAFAIFIALNFAMFVFIGLGQALIYRAIQRSRTASGSQHRGQDVAIAQRLFLVVLTDFCCWFPIGVLGLLASAGVAIPSQMNVWTAVFVMPLNSALNPFLYTLNSLREKQRKQRMQDRLVRTLRKLATEIHKWQPADVNELVKICVQSKMVPKTTMMKWLGVDPDQQQQHDADSVLTSRSSVLSDYTGSVTVRAESGNVSAAGI